MTKWIAILALVLTGCRAGTSFQGGVDIAQWTPDFAGSAQTSGGSGFNLVTSGGVGAKEELWNFDVSLGMQTAGSSQLKPYRLNLGYWHGLYKGSGPASTLTFAGATFNGLDPVRTKGDFKYYKLTYEEPDVKSSGGGLGSITAGLLGIHYLDFSVLADDGAGNSGVFAEGAPMFVLGYRIEQYAKGGLMYYVVIEGMDLDTITLGDVSGSLLDTSAGMKWFIRGDKAAISVGYKKLKAELNIGTDRLDLDMDGVTFGFSMRW